MSVSYMMHRQTRLSPVKMISMKTQKQSDPRKRILEVADCLFYTGGRHRVKPWFAGKLPFSFNLPELQNSEFTLAGGRVAYFQHSQGAQLLFKVRKHQLSVLIFKEEPREFPFHEGTVT